MLLEEGLPEERDILQQGYAGTGKLQRFTGVVNTNVGRRPDTEQRQRQTGGHLIGPQPDREPGKKT